MLILNIEDKGKISYITKVLVLHLCIIIYFIQIHLDSIYASLLSFVLKRPFSVLFLAGGLLFLVLMFR